MPENHANGKSEAAAKRIALVVMPFASEDGPALGPSLLRAALEEAGHDVSLFYENLRFAAMIGLDAYRAIDANPFALTGEWLFAGALHSDGLPPPEEYLHDILGLASSEADRLLDLRAAAARQVGATVKRLIEFNPAIAAFSATFQQTAASLAVARRLREEAPEIGIVLGGAAASGPAAARLLERHPFLDAIVGGEAEEVLPRLIATWRAPAPSDLPGVYRRGQRPPPIEEADVDLERSPPPDFQDYFEQLTASGLPLAPSVTHIRLETSRGCAWGEKRACAFCGLSGATIRHRAKSKERLRREIEALDRYPSRSILVADNLIDHSALIELMRDDPKRTSRFCWFVEASPRLDAETIEAMARGGVRRIQPGIESLSTRILRRLRKGSTATQAVRFLCQALASNIALTWNLLCGDPGETDEELEQQAALIPLLHHLPPPLGLFEVEIHRFSPYHENPEVWGWGALEPIPAYRHLHPFAKPEIDDLAYFFRPKQRRSSPEARAVLADAVRDWRFAATHGATLLHHDDGRTLRVLDRRHGETRLELSGERRERFLTIANGQTSSHSQPADRETEYLIGEGLAVQPDRTPLPLSLPAEGDDPESALELAATLFAARLKALVAEGGGSGT
jgi:magnesium-protoporphyrin IX monomethyl ester (oxidative) cyclase